MLCGWRGSVLICHGSASSFALMHMQYHISILSYEKSRDMNLIYMTILAPENVRCTPDPFPNCGWGLRIRLLAELAINHAP